MNEFKLSEPNSNELAVSAASSQAKALVEAKFTIALNRPRSLSEVREKLLSACKRKKFAESAKYKKPLGHQSITGPSIRFAEECVRSMSNIDVQANLLFEDDEKRMIRISVTDLESNTTYGDDVTIVKTVERKEDSLRGRDWIRKRKNSSGETIYVCKSTEDEFSNKLASAKSKIIRNSSLRIVPSDIIDEAMEVIDKTISNGDSDPKIEAKKILDAMASMGVSARDLEKYLGHSTDSMSPNEVRDLRFIFTAIRDGETNWASVIQVEKKDAKPKFSKGQSKKLPPKEKKTPVKEEPVKEAPVKEEPNTDIEWSNEPDSEWVAQFKSKLSEEGLNIRQGIDTLKKFGFAKKSATRIEEVDESAIYTALSDWSAFLDEAKIKDPSKE